MLVLKDEIRNELINKVIVLDDTQKPCKWREQWCSDFFWQRKYTVAVRSALYELSSHSYKKKYIQVVRYDYNWHDGTFSKSKAEIPRLQTKVWLEGFSICAVNHRYILFTGGNNYNNLDDFSLRTTMLDTVGNKWIE